MVNKKNMTSVIPPILDPGKTYPACTMNPSHPLSLTCRDGESVSGEEDPLGRAQTPPRLSPALPVQKGRKPGTLGRASQSARPGLCFKAISHSSDSPYLCSLLFLSFVSFNYSPIASLKGELMRNGKKQPPSP